MLSLSLGFNNLNQILELCLNYDPEFELQWDLLKDLNKYAVEIRYPGEVATKVDARSALQALKVFRAFVRRKLGLK